ncbi:MAG: 4-oxalocrotonate decarboxylase [Candidatus Carbobacillus altaicus]|uniref:4-oxalocrotonate decarboxylase n=1 Tax=Candidatus Carbonibacillus altaicus TaxID=2163959 RepID=A0A2R6Y0H5_9BACL|nr:MAG: 4-oxalocrotonate decarboxylase [Candidatus Carbobacillus altaicus]
MVTEHDLVTMSQILLAAETNVEAIPRLTERYAFDIEQAYRVQAFLIDEKIKKGMRLAGYKMGLTSPQKMKQMQVSSPVFGVLTAETLLEDGASLKKKKLIHPRVELEVAFVLGDSITPEDDLTPEALAKKIAYTTVALEIIDSRYQDFRFTLPDVIADNTSAAYYVLGSHFARLDDMKASLLHFGAQLWINGTLQAVGTPANVLGHPLTALASLVRQLHQYRGETLKPGQIVLTGGITEAFAVEAGDVIEGVIDHLGSVRIKVSE